LPSETVPDPSFHWSDGKILGGSANNVFGLHS